MKTIPKTNLMLYFLFGISISIISSNCGKELTEYKMNIDIIFVNKTDSTIQFDILKDLSSSSSLISVELNKAVKIKEFNYEYVGVEKEISPTTCCKDFLSNVYSNKQVNGSTKTITLNTDYCVTHFNEKSVLISNYQVKVLNKRHYSFTYYFKGSDFENAVLCE
jgi:hypothetical protein